MGPVQLYRRAVVRVTELLFTVEADDWSAPTPCDGWNVRDLVNHLVNENRWVPLLLGGATMDEVGDRLDGDLLGADPLAAWHDAAGSAMAHAHEPDVPERTVALSFGATPATEYLTQIGADHVVHAWDLATALGRDAPLDDDLVARVASWFDTVEDVYRSAGVIGPRVAVAKDADPRTELLARFGRDAPDPGPRDEHPTAAAVRRLNDGLNARDLEGVIAAFTPDGVFENTAPAPDGERFEGADELRDFWRRFLDGSPAPRFATEELTVLGDRAVARWRYDWADPEAGPGHVRGVDVLRVRNGRVAEKLAYVKG